MQETELIECRSGGSDCAAASRETLIGCNQPGGNPDRWFAAQVRSNQERSVANLLAARDLEVYVPVYSEIKQWSDRVKQNDRPLFPGYVFCRVDPQKRAKLLLTPGVVRIVGAGRAPIPIDDCEMQALKQLVACDVAREPRLELAIGDTVGICGGPLTGIHGVLEQVKGGRKLIVGITLLRRSVAVELDDSWVVVPRKSFYRKAS